MSPLWVAYRWLALLQISGAALCEIERLKNCGKKARCLGKNPKLYENQFNPDLSSSSPCNCDDHCVEFGDCCQDVAPHPNQQPTVTSWTCVPLSLNQSVYAVSTCSLQGLWKTKCEKNVSTDKYHYTMDIPIYSNVTGLFYANIYCAYCHKQLVSLEQPHLTLSCTHGISVNKLLEKGEYQKGELVWKVGNGFCTMFLDGNVRNGRPCVQYVSSCPIGSDPELSAKCNAYAMALSNSREMYRNPHCALCNGVKLSDLRCWYGYDYRTLPSLSNVIGFDWKFDSCGIPERVWDGLQQMCTSATFVVDRSCENRSISDSSTVMPCHVVEVSLNLRIDGYITFICMTASVICLSLHIVVQAILPNPKTLPTKVLNSLAVSLFFAQLLFLCGMSPMFEVSQDICRLIAILLQYFYLASFFWMNALSIDIYVTFSKGSMKQTTDKSYTKYTFYALGGATFVTVASVIAEQTDWLPDYYRPYYAANPKFCWFGNRVGLAIFFYFPSFFLALLNTTLFAITICWFQKQHASSETLKNSGRKEYNRLWLYIKLSTIMGTSWAFGLVTSFTKMAIYRYPFTILNGLQGVFIFIMFDLKSEVVAKVMKQIEFSDVRKNSTNKGESQTSTTSKGSGKTWTYKYSS